ncbi:MAG: DNA methyltransferase [Armatimonadetes bacterium]|nr:DNA methyltransferase [Armatimonadota bacterium]
MSGEWKNKLFFGDNLEVLRRYIADESVDLIYLDPPFNSKATYNVLFKEKNGTSAAAQIRAFDDFWHWDISAEEAYREVVQGGGKIADLLDALRRFLGSNDMMAYLTMMAIRLKELHRVLKPTGSLYLHCDPTASHYLKLVLDAIFGPENFRNEIIWKRAQPKAHATRRFPSSHDTVFAYSRSAATRFNPVRGTHDETYVDKFYRFVEEDTGRRYTLADLTNPNKARPNLTYEFPPGSGVVRVWRWTRQRMMREWRKGRVIVPPGGGVVRYKRYLDEMPGPTVTDVWTDIEHLHGSHKEALGFPTQKPEALLDRIIRASSNEGDLVLDPFCGCGTTVVVAERLHRRWIGIDITHLAVTLMKTRLEDTFGTELSPYEVIGEPVDLASARALAAQDRFQFQCWALGLVGARPARDPQRGADKGVDGVITFLDDDSGEAKRAVIQVKSGHVGTPVVRDLKGTMEREKAQVGALITLEEPTQQMRTEAAAAGFYDPPGLLPPVPRLQILTIQGLLDGTERLELPVARHETFERAPRRGKAPRRR